MFGPALGINEDPVNRVLGGKLEAQLAKNQLIDYANKNQIQFKVHKVFLLVDQVQLRFWFIWIVTVIQY